MQFTVPIYKLKRSAKLLARAENIPLHQAQDCIAREEGFSTWSALAAQVAKGSQESTLLPNLVEGDMLLLGARPGHGKTLLGLQLLIDAARDNRRAVLFTLEATEKEVGKLIRTLDKAGNGSVPEIVTSSEISADYIVQYLSGAPRGTIAVIDFLQILDQQRTKPVLGEQMKVLEKFAKENGVIFGFISQIDRSFDESLGLFPGMQDIRLPNPIPASVFSKTCFLQHGEARFQPFKMNLG